MIIKKIALTFLLILLSGFLITGCNNGTTNLNQEKTLVCLGDSLTAGRGATTPGVDDKTKSYPAFLQNKISIPVINAGVSGNTTAQGLSRVKADVLSKNPQIIIINLGANDLFQRVSVNTTRENLQNIIKRVNGGNRKIYLAKFYTDEVVRAMGNSLQITNDSILAALRNQYDDMFNSIASKNKVTLIEDIWAGVWGIHMSDFIHPDAAGYEIMANNYFNVLEPYLLENGLLK